MFASRMDLALSTARRVSAGICALTSCPPECVKCQTISRVLDRTSGAEPCPPVPMVSRNPARAWRIELVMGRWTCMGRPLIMAACRSRPKGVSPISLCRSLAGQTISSNCACCSRMQLLHRHFPGPYCNRQLPSGMQSSSLFPAPVTLTRRSPIQAYDHPAGVHVLRREVFAFRFRGKITERYPEPFEKPFVSGWLCVVLDVLDGGLFLHLRARLAWSGDWMIRKIKLDTLNNLRGLLFQIQFCWQVGSCQN